MGGVGVAADIGGNGTLVGPGDDVAKFNGQGFWLITGWGNLYSLDSWRSWRLRADAGGSTIGNEIVGSEVDKAADQKVNKDNSPER